MTTATASPSCPKCSGGMWDETTSKYYKPGKPIWKCKDKACGGVIWPPKNGSRPAAASSSPAPHSAGAQMPWEAEQEESEQQFTSRVNGAGTVDRLNAMIQAFDICYDHALVLAAKTAKAGYVVGMDGINACAATLFIGAKDRGIIP